MVGLRQNWYLADLGGFFFNTLVHVLLHEKGLAPISWQDRLTLVKPSQLSLARE